MIDDINVINYELHRLKDERSIDEFRSSPDFIWKHEEAFRILNGLCLVD